MMSAEARSVGIPSRAISIAILFAVVFGFAVFLLVCTASVSSRYLPSRSYLVFCHPVLVSVVFALIVRKMAFSIRMRMQFLFVGVSECFLLLLWVWFRKEMDGSYRSDVVLPEERSFFSTVAQSLVKQQFSNRSYFTSFGVMLCHSLVWLVSLLPKLQAQEFE